MTDEELEAIRARAAAATPGPWDASSGNIYTGDGFQTICYDIDGDREGTDGIFIAAARTDIPALLAEVEQLRARCAEWQAIATRLGLEVERLQVEILEYEQQCSSGGKHFPLQEVNRCAKCGQRLKGDAYPKQVLDRMRRDTDESD